MRRILALATAAALLVSCTGARTSPTDRATSAPWRGGTLRWAIANRWDTTEGLDPTAYVLSDGWELYRCCLLRTLVSYGARGTAVRPDLATSLPDVSPDGLEWTFRLRGGLRYAPPFEDTEIVAQDFVRALERLATPSALPNENYAFYFEVVVGFAAVERGTADRISGLETPDDHTLVVRLTAPAGDLPNRFALAATAWGYRVRSVPGIDDRVRLCMTLDGTEQTRCWAELDRYLTARVVPEIPLFERRSIAITRLRVDRFSIDAGAPAFDRISLVPGSE